jgi:hypothetical protein
MASNIRSRTGGKPSVKRGKDSRNSVGEFSDNKRATTGGIAKESYGAGRGGVQAKTDKSKSHKDIGRNAVGNDATAGNSRRDGSMVDKPKGTSVVGAGGRNSITGNSGRMV